MAHRNRKSGDIAERIRRYFRQKTAQLRAAADAAVCDHPGLIGSHREQLQRIYLDSILPKRFAVGRGMVYGNSDSRSHEADIVIWDSQNFPKLPLEDHSFFFAESVRLVMECKSNWNEENFTDVREKCRSLHAITSHRLFKRPENFLLLEMKMHLAAKLAFKDTTPLSRIRTAAVFLNGGQSFSFDTMPLDPHTADEEWPDLILLLAAGKVIRKRCEEVGKKLGGKMVLAESGDDSLLLFTAELLTQISEESFAAEESLRLLDYLPALNFPETSCPFEPRRKAVVTEVKIVMKNAKRSDGSRRRL